MVQLLISQNTKMKKLETQLTQFNTSLLGRLQGTVPSNRILKVRSNAMLSLFEVVKHLDKVEEKRCHRYASPILGQFMFKVQNFHFEPSTYIPFAPT